MKITRSREFPGPRCVTDFDNDGAEALHHANTKWRPNKVKASGAEAGFIVAFGNAYDEHRDWAIKIARDLTEPLLTCDAVLAEAAFLLRDGELVLELVRREMLEIRFDLKSNLTNILDLAKGYRVLRCLCCN